MDAERNIYLLETLKTLEQSKSDYEVMLSTAKTGLEATKTQIEQIRRELVGGFKGRNTYTHAQTVEARRSIIRVLQGGANKGQIQDALPHIEAYLLERELKTLVDKGAVKWNGKRGTASKYYRAA